MLRSNSKIPEMLANLHAGFIASGGGTGFGITTLTARGHVRFLWRHFLSAECGQLGVVADADVVPVAKALLAELTQLRLATNLVPVFTAVAKSAIHKSAGSRAKRKALDRKATDVWRRHELPEYYQGLRVPQQRKAAL